MRFEDDCSPQSFSDRILRVDTIFGFLITSTAELFAEFLTCLMFFWLCHFWDLFRVILYFVPWNSITNMGTFCFGTQLIAQHVFSLPFQTFLMSIPILGELIQFDDYSSNGLIKHDSFNSFSDGFPGHDFFKCQINRSHLTILSPPPEIAGLIIRALLIIGY